MGKWKTKQNLKELKKYIIWRISPCPSILYGNGRNENQISKQAAIIELLAPDNNSHWRGPQCRQQ
jgi:hypothetical protein